MRKDFSKSTYKNPGAKHATQKAAFKAPEEIDIKEHYTKQDVAELKHLNFTAGLPPYLRGPYSSMYVIRPWTIRQYAGFSTAEDSNAFYRRNLAAAKKVFQ